MSGFGNTVEIVGDDALTDSIIQRSISGALNDDQATKIGNNAFRWCSGLTSVNLPSVVTIEHEAFAWCTGLKTVDLASVESITSPFGWCYALATIIIRNPTKVCTLSGGFGANCPLGKNSGQIYVPASLLEGYRTAAGWSAYASQLQALEDWTDDGTIHGNLTTGYTVSYRLQFVSSSNAMSKTGRRYATTLTADTEIEKVSITMGGVDITAEVYNAETGEINIPLVTGDLVITAKAAPGDDQTVVSCTVGSIAWDTGLDDNNGANFRTGAIPYSSAVNKFRADALFNGNASNARVLLRPYDKDMNFVEGSFAAVITPAATKNWALIGTEYTLNYDSNVAFVRAVFSSDSGAAATSISGSITVSGVTYELVQEV